MKKHYFIFNLLLFLSLAVSSNSQVFSPPGATWVFHSEPVYAVTFERYEIWQFEGDTTVLSEDAKKIRYKSAIIHFWGDVMYSDTVKIFRVTGDSVYILKHEPIEEWKLIYDFSVQVGDSVASPWETMLAFGQYGPPCDSSYYHTKAEVINTGTVNVDGQDLRFYSVKFPYHSWSNGPEYGTFTITERMIASFGPAGTYFYPEVDDYWCGMITESMPRRLQCYRDDQIETHPGCESLDWFDNLSSINEVTHNGYSIFPNPAGETLHVKLMDPGSSDMARIYNSQGQLCISQTVCVTSEQINISQLPAGMYILKLDQLSEKMNVFIKF